ncbi:T-cell differentiation antigen CD6-like, partial [Bufo gargarizans]|uniref:T-cell differentiation antigen CD6-like n=1 Tax=Bufo gargarizans TaxID=30331 RepID=UPI001CF5C33A
MEAKTLSFLCLYLLWISWVNPEGLDTPFIQLAGSDKRCQGAVQVLMENTWHHLCETALNRDLSEQICRMQNCGKPILPSTGQEVNASSPFLNITCGAMVDIRNCSFSQLAEDECDGAAFLNCTDRSALRLAGSNGPCAGRVEIFMDGVWGSVCHNGWDALDAEITCQQINCGSALSALRGSYFGSGPPQIHRNEVDCKGGEHFLWECEEHGNRDCSAGEHAGVICTEYRDVRLSGGANNCSGRVEVYLHGVWATVCDSHWYEDDSSMLCKYLGCGPFQNQTRHEHSLSTYAAFLCSKAKSLWDCSVYINKAHMCHQSKALGITCQAGAIIDSSVTRSKTPGTSDHAAP